MSFLDIRNFLDIRSFLDILSISPSSHFRFKAVNYHTERVENSAEVDFVFRAFEGDNLSTSKTCNWLEESVKLFEVRFGTYLKVDNYRV